MPPAGGWHPPPARRTCAHRGPYQARVVPAEGAYLDLATLYRNLTHDQLATRLFCPQVVTDTGAKLPKSLIREGRASLPEAMTDAPSSG